MHAIPESVPVELSSACVYYIEACTKVSSITSRIDSVLVLFRNYPGDPSLQGYLRVAIQDGLLPLPVFVSTFLSGARSPEFHNISTLDMLCRIALEAHYSSGRQPEFSVVPPNSPMNDILGTVQDAMNLLRTAHNLPSSHFPQINASASELLMLLLSCTHNLSQLTTAQAMIHFANASDILQLRLNPDIQQLLETHVLSLSLLLGDDAKAAREAQMMHNLQLALGKGDIVGPNSDTDIVSCGRLPHSLVGIYCTFLSAYTDFSFRSLEELVNSVLAMDLVLLPYSWRLSDGRHGLPRSSILNSSSPLSQGWLRLWL